MKSHNSKWLAENMHYTEVPIKQGDEFEWPNELEIFLLEKDSIVDAEWKEDLSVVQEQHVES